MNRTQLFDVGIAGPLAGFFFIVPALALGLLLSTETSDTGGGIAFGEPLLFQLVQWVLGQSPTGTVLLHPVGFAAWFGILATSLNLLPLGQLDGGHIVYALFGPRVHRWITLLTFSALIGVSFLPWPPFLGYILFGILGMTLGRRHPPTMLDDQRPDRSRWWIACLGLLIFILTFMPIPIELIP